MKILKWLIVLSILIFWISCVTADTLEFSDDFNRSDSETVGNSWTESHDASSRINQSHLKVLWDGSTYSTVSHTSTASGLYNYSIILNASENNARRFFSIYGTAANKKFTFYFKDDGNVAYYNGDLSVVCDTYMANTDYNLTIQYNQTNGSAKYYIDSVFQAEVGAGITTADTNKIEVKGGISGTTFWDDMIVWNITVAPSGAPSITSFAPSTPNSSWANVDKSFNFTTDQTGNHTYYMNTVLVQTNTSVTTSTYTNLSANNTGKSGLQNLTMNVTNTNGTDTQKIDWTINVNYVTTNITYDDRTNLSCNRKFDIITITPGVDNISIGYGNTDSGNSYGLYFSNGTQIATTQTATSNDEMVYFNDTVAVFEVANDYFINESDSQSPKSITGLTNTTGIFWHNWTWTNPIDVDYNYTTIYINGVWAANTSLEYYNLSASAHNQSTISTKTVDTTGNVNATWVNHTSIIPNNPTVILDEPNIFSKISDVILETIKILPNIYIFIIGVIPIIITLAVAGIIITFFSIISIVIRGGV